MQLLPFLSENKAMPETRLIVPPLVTKLELLRQQRVYPEPIKKGKKATKQVVNGS